MQHKLAQICYLIKQLSTFLVHKWLKSLCDKFCHSNKFNLFLLIAMTHEDLSQISVWSDEFNQGNRSKTNEDSNFGQLNFLTLYSFWRRKRAKNNLNPFKKLIFSYLGVFKLSNDR
jgi:hypothetical protein